MPYSCTLLNQLPQLTSNSNQMAFGKARYDINTIAANNGIPVRNIVCRFYKVPLLTTLNVLRQYVSFLSSNDSHNEIVIQYPVSCPKAFHWAIKLLRMRHLRFVLLIHDIDSLRFHGDVAKEVALFNKANGLIVHTEAMAELLRQEGVRVPMRVLRLFDYLTVDGFMLKEEQTRHRKDVIFAGYLKKSKFLPALCNHDFGDITFRLYGIKDDSIDFDRYKGKKYCGVFDSNHTGRLVGGWGLVWDGDSIETCAGGLGEYLHYNLPHKLSLYLAAGLPVIVWSQSGVAGFVREQKLGISVGSLLEIPALLDNLTEQEYSAIAANCRKMGKRLRGGEMVLAALRQD